MRSRRIILSDDEDSPRKESSARMVLSTPGSSTELLNHLSNLNVRSGAKAPENVGQSKNKPQSTSSSNAKQSGIAAPQNEEEEFNSSDELDAETTLRAMQGNLDQASQDGEDYEAMIQPVKKTQPSPPVTSSSRSARTSTSGGSRTTASSSRVQPITQSQQPSSPAGRPRRQSAMRAEQLLHNIYSEYDQTNKRSRGRQQDANDDDQSDGTYAQNSQEGSDVEEGDENENESDDPQHPHAHHKNSRRQRTEAEEDLYFIDDSDLAPPARPKARSSSNSRKQTSRSERSTHSSAHSTSPSPPLSPSQRRASARTASLSSRKELQYQQAQQALRRASGLSTVLLSSDEDSAEEGEGQDNMYDSALRTQDHTPSDSDHHARRHSTHSQRSKPNTTYSYSKSKLRSPAQVVGLLHRRDERDAESSGSASDIDDFIVHSDEEREEEEERAEQARLRRQQRKEQKERKERKHRHNGGSRKAAGGDGSKAADVISAATARYNNSTSTSNTATTSSSSGRNKHNTITIDSSEEDEGEKEGDDDENMVISRSSQKPKNNNNSSSSGSHHTTTATNTATGGTNADSNALGRKRKIILDSDDEEVVELGKHITTAPNTARMNSKKHKHSRENTRSTRTNTTVTTGASNNKKQRLDDDNSDDSFIAPEQSDEEGVYSDGSVHSGSGGSEGSQSGSGSDGSGTSNSSSGSSDSSSESDEDSDLDGPMLYYKVNSMRDRREEEGGLTDLANMRKRFTIPEAMRLYIELLAHVLIDPHYLQEANNPGSAAPLSKHHHQHRTHKQKADQQAAVLHRTQYQSATRQIENLICTNRESLIGSGAWNKEFYADLQSRPFYSVAPRLMCTDTKVGLGMYDVPGQGSDYSGDEGERRYDEEKVRCAACNRTTQLPDLQVYLFGSTYDARQVWNSSRWDQQMPRELFLYADEEPADEDYMHHPHNNINSATKSSSSGMYGSSSVYGSGGSGKGSAHKTPSKNRQMRAYDRIVNGEVRQYGGVHVLASGGVGSVNTSRASRGGSGIVIDDDMVQAVRSRKRRIVQSDDEEDEEIGGERKRRQRGSPADASRPENEEGGGDGGESGNESSDLEILPSEEELRAAEEAELTRAWWKQKFPREFTVEREKVFMLSAHCKNRTRLYHTLLHYKFRLLMNIRAKIQSIANVMCGQQSAEGRYGSGSKSNSAYMYDTSWESWEGPDRQYLLEAAVEELKQDSSFIEGEARRFQTLIKETERRYGGREEPRHDNIWGDDDHHGSHPAYTARHANNNTAGASGGANGANSGGSGRKPMSQQTKTIMGWLTKQK